MVKQAEVLAIIPARGGSKGIPHKNIRKFAGHPLIAYSIQAALNSTRVTRVIVSTDDPDIAQVARDYGAEVPFLRPSEYAQDQSLDLPVFQHALAWLAENENYHPDVVVQLRPTSPIRPLWLVDEAVDLLLAHPQADSVRGVVPAGQNPHKMWRIDPATGQMHGLLQVEGIDEPYNAPRQVLPPVYWQTGHIDAIRPRVLQANSMSGKVILPVLIDPQYAVDIDGPSDWQKAEWLVWYGGLEMVTPGNRQRSFPEKVGLVVFDFDGVMTDNRVWVDQNGVEMVAANRSDGLGVLELHQAGIKTIVISKERNPVVAARCKKLNIPVLQGIDEKRQVLIDYLAEQNIPSSQVIYVGNDTNDIPCFDVVGCALAVADAHPAVLRQADIILQHSGGHGAVRECCDRILQQIKTANE
ncbi:MAG: acylneuraminate cytidylyltransferase [Anaerolineaceae bacterium]